MTTNNNNNQINNTHSRMIVMENNLQHMSQRFDKYIETEEEYRQLHAKLIQEIRDEQAKMKGFWGGVVFVFSALSIAAAGFINSITGTGK